MQRAQRCKPRLATALLLGWVAALTGCANGSALSASTVLAYDQCQGLSPGLTRVDYQAVAGIRGSTLLSMTGADGETAADDTLLVAISRGQQPTPGYAMSLAGARRENGTAVIEVRWETPPVGAVLAQMLTHPCLVVGISEPDIRRVEAQDQNGTSLGTLNIL